MQMSKVYVNIEQLAVRSICYDVNNPTLKYVVKKFCDKVVLVMDTFGKIRRIKNGTIVTIKGKA